MDAEMILRRLTEAYSVCQSYSDKGHVSFDYDQRKEVITFETSFVRPKLRFEWEGFTPRTGKSGHNFHLVFDGIHTYTCFNGVDAEKESLLLGIAGATGCSVGAAAQVPALLLGVDELRNQFIDLQNPKFIDRRISDRGEECDVIEGITTSGIAVELWISTTDFFLRYVRHDRSRYLEQVSQNPDSLLPTEDQSKLLMERGLRPGKPQQLQSNSVGQITEYVYTDIKSN